MRANQPPRFWRQPRPLRCVNPCHESDPDENPPSCSCGGRRFWFIAQDGKGEPELLCENCSRFAQIRN